MKKPINEMTTGELINTANICLPDTEIDTFLPTEYTGRELWGEVLARYCAGQQEIDRLNNIINERKD